MLICVGVRVLCEESSLFSVEHGPPMKGCSFPPPLHHTTGDVILKVNGYSVTRCSAVEVQAILQKW